MALTGGGKLERVLAEIGARAAAGSPVVKVGFLEGATYPDGTPVAMVAAIQNFGAPSRGIPPRPFFDKMIADHKAEWPGQLGAALRARDYDAKAALEAVGQVMRGELAQAIVETNEPPLKPATVRRKGFSKPLVDTGHMLGSIDSEVTE